MSMSMSTVPLPLADITNSKMLQSNKQHFDSPQAQKCSFESSSPLGLSSSPDVPEKFTHNPYHWKCIPDEAQIALIMTQRSALDQQRAARRQVQVQQVQVTPMSPPVIKEVPMPATTTVACKALVQFKCHQTEFSSPLIVDKGQYVVVQGDRGIDIGVVIRVNTDSNKSYVERTGPNGCIIRHATQREVDYWATDLKADEATALEYCKERVGKMRLPMEVKYAEYQFDKKKLTFYYEAKARVDFVTMLKELYREFGCRIWMEKVRLNQME